jgi:hypothetical protein
MRASLITSFSLIFNFALSLLNTISPLLESMSTRTSTGGRTSRKQLIRDSQPTRPSLGYQRQHGDPPSHQRDLYTPRSYDQRCFTEPRYEACETTANRLRLPSYQPTEPSRTDAYGTLPGPTDALRRQHLNEKRTLPRLTSTSTRWPPSMRSARGPTPSHGRSPPQRTGSGAHLEANEHPVRISLAGGDAVDPAE